MTDNEANDIILNAIQAHWPKWNFKGQELRVWIEELHKFDYETAKAAINELYRTWEKIYMPKMPHMLGAIRRQVVSRRDGEGKRTGPLFGIIRADGRPRWRKFSGDMNMPRQEIEVIAEKLCRHANQLEPDHYIEYYSTDEEPEGYTGKEGCTVMERRAQARDKAFADILNGPDTKTRRWLVRYFERVHGVKKDKPQHVGEVVNI